MFLSNLPYFSALRVYSVLACGVLLLSACSDKELILSGTREPVFQQTEILENDEQAASEFGAVGPAYENLSAGQPGLDSGHAGGHLTLSTPLKKLWSARIREPEDEVVSLPQPVIANDLVYGLGADAKLTAFDLDTGSVAWQAQINDPKSGLFPGKAGGMAVNDKVIAVHAARKRLAVLNAQTGEQIWQLDHDSPLTGGPTLIGGGAVVVTDIDGYVFVYDQKDGRLLWQNVGLPVDTVVFGASAPAVNANMLVLAGAGGEVATHQINDGQLFWAESLANLSPTTPLEELGDVLAHPVHDGEMVYVISQSGLLSAFDARAGFQLWEQPIAGVEMPWIAGDSLFVLTVEGQLLNLRRSDGAIRWVSTLEGSAKKAGLNPDKNIQYYGPVVASDLVHVLSAQGKLVSINADTGIVVSTQSLGGRAATAPQLAKSTLIYLTRSGQITALR